MSADAQPAASSPASLPALDLGTLSAPDLAEWKLTGNVPEPKVQETPADSPTSADSASAPPVEQAASTDAIAPAASEPATPKKNADTRIKELLAERHAERTAREAAERRAAELEARLGKSDAPAAPSPAPVGDQFPAFDAWHETHPDGLYDDYLLDKFKHHQRVEREATERQQAEQRITEQRQERIGSFLQRFDEAVSADPGIAERLNPQIAALRPVDSLQPGEPITAHNAVAQEIVESEHAVKLILHFSEHPEALDAITQLSPTGVIRAMAKLEASLSAPSVPPVKTVSSAPPPPTTLGRRPGTQADPVTAAIANRDAGAYMREMNARELAGTR